MVSPAAAVQLHGLMHFAHDEQNASSTGGLSFEIPFARMPDETGIHWRTVARAWPGLTSAPLILDQEGKMRGPHEKPEINPTTDVSDQSGRHDSGYRGVNGDRPQVRLGRIWAFQIQPIHGVRTAAGPWW